MAKSTKALLTGRIQKCKTNPSIAHIGLATHGRSIQIGSNDIAIHGHAMINTRLLTAIVDQLFLACTQSSRFTEFLLLASANEIASLNACLCSVDLFQATFCSRSMRFTHIGVWESHGVACCQ
jgi:hypothetical protein